jgi:G3E family GTPase
MPKMRTLVIGGFSGFAKRALVERSISSMMKEVADARITVLLNGEEDFVTNGSEPGMDLYLEQFGEGCFCCTLRDPLTISLRAQKEERRPDLLLIVVSVIADMGSVNGLIDSVLGEGSDVIRYFSIDLENAIALMDSFKEMIERNIRSSDFVLLAGDGITSVDPMEGVVQRLKELSPFLEQVASYNAEHKMIFFLRV